MVSPQAPYDAGWTSVQVTPVVPIGVATSDGVAELPPVVKPSPRAPSKLVPQQYAAPVVVTPQVTCSRAVIADHRTPGGAATSAGASETMSDVDPPLPSSPSNSAPQQ